MSDFNPYQAPQALLADSVEHETILAERGTRLGAAFLDGLIAGGPFAIIGIVAAIAIPAALASHGDRTGFAALAVIVGILGLGWVITMLVWNLRWISLYGQTIGKRICKIKVVRTDGSPIALGRYIGLRWLPLFVLGLIPYLGYVVGLVDCLLIFRESRQCLHDQFADTKVVVAD